MTMKTVAAAMLMATLAAGTAQADHGKRPYERPHAKEEGKQCLKAQQGKKHCPKKHKQCDKTKQCKKGGYGHKGGHGDWQKRGERMLNAINATPEQRAAIHAEFKASRPQMKALREQMHTERQALKQLDPMAPGYQTEVDRRAATLGQLVTQKVQAKAAMKARMAAHLTAEQRATVRQLHTDRAGYKGHHKSRQGHHQGWRKRHGAKQGEGKQCLKNRDHHGKACCKKKAKQCDKKKGEAPAQPWRSDRRPAQESQAL